MNQSDINQDFQRAALKAAIIEEGKILLGKRISDDEDNGLFELPGGKADRGESLEEALKREVLEEAGVRVEGVNLEGGEGFPLFLTQSRNKGTMIVVVSAKIKEGQSLLKESEELGEIGFYSKDEVQVMYDNNLIKVGERTLIERFLKGKI